MVPGTYLNYGAWETSEKLHIKNVKLFFINLVALNSFQSHFYIKSNDLLFLES